MSDLFFEDWAASYGSPYLIGDDQVDGTAVLAEHAESLRVAPAPCDPRPAAFVDGVRRGEGLLYRQGDDGGLVRGLHVSPRLGDKPVDRVTIADVETIAAAMLDAGLAPKTVRNVITFLHSVFEHAIDRGWTTQNPVRRASRPKRRRAGDANPDLQFLTVPELEAVLRAIHDEVVVRAPAPTRRGRAGSAPPVPPDVLGPVIRVVVLTAAMTGLRQSELLGLRWRDVDWTAQRIRVRNAWVRGEHSGEGKSDLSTRRSVPMADRLARELDRWSRRTLYGADDDLVFAHPHSGRPLDRTKLTRRFKAACIEAGVRPIRFHEYADLFVMPTSAKKSWRAGLIAA